MFMGEVLNCINFALHCISVAENAICNGLRAQSHAFPDRSRDKSVTTPRGSPFSFLWVFQ